MAARVLPIWISNQPQRTDSDPGLVNFRMQISKLNRLAIDGPDIFLVLSTGLGLAA